MKFGFLGVGSLSTPMLEHFLADGHAVVVLNGPGGAALDADYATVDILAGASFRF